MDFEKAFIIAKTIMVRCSDIDDETGTDILRLLDKALIPKVGEESVNAVPHKEEQ